MSITLHRFEAHTDTRCRPELHEDWREQPACHFVYCLVPGWPACGEPERNHHYWEDPRGARPAGAQGGETTG